MARFIDSSVLDQIQIFERLSRFGDLKQFLQKIAQQPYPFPTENILNNLRLILTNLEGVNKLIVSDLPNNHSQLTSLISYLENSLNVRIYPEQESLKSGADLLIKILSSIRTECTKLSNEQVKPDTKQNLLDLVQQCYRTINDVIVVDPLVAKLYSNITQAPKPIRQYKSKYQSIPKMAQFWLNHLLVPSGEINRLDLDGQLGPKTEEALSLFKQQNSLPQDASLQETLELLEDTHKDKCELDDCKLKRQTTDYGF